MEISKISRKNGTWYMVPLKPEPLALSVYMLILSLIISNMLWMNVLYICTSLEFIDMKDLVKDLLSIHFVYAVATTFVWRQMLKELGKSLITQITFFVWQGSKLFAACLEICSFNKFYKKIVYNTPEKIYAELSWHLALGLLAIGGIEIFGLILASKYLKEKKPFRKTKTQLNYSATVLAI